LTGKLDKITVFPKSLEKNSVLYKTGNGGYGDHCPHILIL